MLLPAPFGPTRATFSPAPIDEVEPLERLEAVGVREVEVLDHDGGGRRPGGIVLVPVMLVGRGVLAVVVGVDVLVDVACRLDGAHRTGTQTRTTTVNATHSSRTSPSHAYSTGRSARLWRWRNSPSKPRACIAA